MTHQVDDNKPSAVSTHVANHIDQVTRGQMMCDIQAESHVCARQRVFSRIGSDNRDRRADRGIWIDIHANYSNSERARDLCGDKPGATPNVHYLPDRQGIPPDRADHKPCIAQPAVDCGQIPIRTVYQLLRDTSLLENFCTVLAHHPLGLCMADAKSAPVFGTKTSVRDYLQP